MPIVTLVPASKSHRAVFAASVRASRESRGMTREAVIFELTKLGNPTSISTLSRWEREGTLKAEDAYYLTQVYGMSLNELLLKFPFPASPKAARRKGDARLRAVVEEDLAMADEIAPGEEDQAPPDDEEDAQ